MKTTTRTLLFAALPLILAGRCAVAQTRIFADEFSGPYFNANAWNYYSSYRIMDRSRMGNAPTIGSDNGNGFAHLRMDTYDPTTPGSYLRGTEMLSRQDFNLGTGLEFEARLRAPNLPRGAVVAFFPLGERGTYPDSYMKTETDYEFIANQLRSQLWLNIWDDYNPQRGGPNSVVNPTVSNLDWSGWNVYKIRWLPDHTDWLVNDVLVRHETVVQPADPMKVHFNIWAPSSGWGTSYDSSLKPTADPNANTSCAIDVDYLHVTTIPPASGANIGTGTGVASIYYDNMDFTGNSVWRVDPRINFNWGAVGPDPTMGVDTFSARWTGQVQAQHTEAYTFYTRTDDGVRLWINGQEIINQWKDQPATEYSAVVNLTAGVKYDLKMEYYHNTGATAAELRWSSASTPKQLIPQSQLYPGTLPGATSTVLTPGPYFSYTSFPVASGTANGAAEVRGRLFRYADGSYWNGVAWTPNPGDQLVDGNTNWTCVLPLNMIDGMYNFQAFATDFNGNAVPSVGIDFYIDNSAPSLIISAPQTNAGYSTLSQAYGTCADPPTGMQDVRGRIQRYADNKYWNGSAWTTTSTDLLCTGLNYWSLNLPPLANGKYNYLATARDYDANTSTASVDFTVDNTPHWRATDISAGADNKTRVLLINDDGRAAVWVVAPNGTLEVNNTYGPYTGWTASHLTVGADLKTRLMWVHQDGRAALWVVAGGNQSSGGGAMEIANVYGPYSGWSAVGLASGADNKMRVLWRNSNGQASAWLVAPGSQSSGGGGLESNVTYGPYDQWTATGIASGGDNKLRLLWTSTAGAASTWVVGPNATTESNNTYGPYTGWTPRSIAVGADGLTRLMWTHHDGHVALWVLAAGQQPSGGGLVINNSYGPYAGRGARALASGGDNLMRLMLSATDSRTELWVVASGGQSAGGGGLASDQFFGPY